MADMTKFSTYYQTHLGRKFLPLCPRDKMKPEDQAIFGIWQPFVSIIKDEELEQLFEEIERLTSKSKYSNLRIGLFKRALQQIRVGDVYQTQQKQEAMPLDCCRCSDGMMAVPFVYAKGKAHIGFGREGYGKERINTCDIPCSCKRGEIEHRYCQRVNYPYSDWFRNEAKRYYDWAMDEKLKDIQQLTDKKKQEEQRAHYRYPGNFRLYIENLVCEHNITLSNSNLKSPETAHNCDESNTSTQSHTNTPEQESDCSEVPLRASTETKLVNKEKFKKLVTMDELF